MSLGGPVWIGLGVRILLLILLISSFLCVPLLLLSAHAVRSASVLLFYVLIENEQKHCS